MNLHQEKRSLQAHDGCPGPRLSLQCLCPAHGSHQMRPVKANPGIWEARPYGRTNPQSQVAVHLIHQAVRICDGHAQLERQCPRIKYALVSLATLGRRDAKQQLQEGGRELMVSPVVHGRQDTYAGNCMPFSHNSPRSVCAKTQVLLIVQKTPCFTSSNTADHYLVFRSIWGCCCDRTIMHIPPSFQPLNIYTYSFASGTHWQCAFCPQTPQNMEPRALNFQGQQMQYFESPLRQDANLLRTAQAYNQIIIQICRCQRYFQRIVTVVLPQRRQLLTQQRPVTFVPTFAGRDFHRGLDLTGSN